MFTSLRPFEGHHLDRTAENGTFGFIHHFDLLHRVRVCKTNVINLELRTLVWLEIILLMLNTVAVVDLDRRLKSGEVIARLTDDDFDVPTTVALLDDSLFLPNARFGTAGPEPAEYWITRIDAFDEGDHDD